MAIIKVDSRDITIPNTAKKSRKKGKIPGILYGNGMSNFMFEVGEIEFNKAIAEQGEHAILDVGLSGNTQKVIIKELQREPLSKNIIHVDLESIDKESDIKTEVPVIFSNEGIIGKNGGVIQREKDKIKIQCKPDKLPKFIQATIPEKSIGSCIKVSDIEVSSDITVLESPETVLISINYVASKDEVE